jgi:predicted TIM-barrel fold metal-dependent hydrolase
VTNGSAKTSVCGPRSTSPRKILPSEYLRQHIRFGSQPMPNVPSKQDLVTFLKWMWAEEVLVFANDYLHWDWDEPSTFLAGFDAEFRRKVMVENARELYGARLDRNVG